MPKGRPPRDDAACLVFASNLDRSMREQRCRNNDLAEDTGISVSTISRLRNGKQYPSGMTLRKISNALDVSINILLGH